MRSLHRKFTHFVHPLKKGQKLKEVSKQRIKEDFVLPTVVNSEGKAELKVQTTVADFVEVSEYNPEFHKPGLREGEKPIPASPYLYPFTVSFCKKGETPIHFLQLVPILPTAQKP